jgi:hypothetical protein
MTKLASPQPLRKHVSPAWHAGFLAMLPTIEQYACVAFRRLRGDSRNDAVEEAIANALVVYVRLVELKKTEVAHPTVLAKYAIAQVFDGRRVGNHLNVREVLSHYAQRAKGFTVERLDRFDQEEGVWREAVVEDHQTPVADQAAFRIDFPTWLAIHPRRDRRIAETLALGHSTGEVAKRFHLTPGRISQKRRSFCASWQSFHGESVVENKVA